MPEAADTVIEAARAFLGERITTNATLRHLGGKEPIKVIVAQGRLVSIVV